MGALIDTSVFVRIERGDRAAEERLAAYQGPVAISAISASELLHGVYRAGPAHLAARQAFVEQLLASLPVIPFDLIAARTHGRLWADLARAGSMVGERDLLIAATAIANGHDVLTCDARSFPRIPGLRAVVW